MASLTLELIEKFIRENQKVVLSDNAVKRIKTGRKLIDKWVHSGEAVYGVTTGFGEFSNIRISENDTKKLQRNLIVSHSAGVGENLPPLIVKIMMLLRANALASGNSGIRLSTLEHLISMINCNILPVIPSQGSVGSSGDLAPLSHLVLAMIGEGDVQIVKNVLDDKFRIGKNDLFKSGF
jgi:histidine ammonia-lyase